MDVVVTAQINGLTCFAVGGLSNLLLLWLIRRRSPKELKEHRILLLQTCYTDLLTLIIFFLTVPVAYGIYSQFCPNTRYFQALIVDQQGNGVYLCLGVLSYFSPPMMFNSLLYLVWNSIASYESYSLTLMFVYRYLAVCR